MLHRQRCLPFDRVKSENVDEDCLMLELRVFSVCLRHAKSDPCLVCVCVCGAFCCQAHCRSSAHRLLLRQSPGHRLAASLVLTVSESWSETEPTVFCICSCFC